MMFKSICALTLLTASTLSTAAHAEAFFAIKGGLVDYDTRGAQTGMNASLQVGYDFLDLALADVAVEAELVRSVLEGETYHDNVDFKSFGLYASLRSAGPVYLIGRLGFADVSIGDAEETAPSYGFGIGFSTGLRWEIEYTSYEADDVDAHYLTLGVMF